MKKKIIIAAILSSTISLANAATQNNNIQVKATPVAGCLISATSFNFGDINSKVLKETDGTLTLQCSKGTQVTIIGTDKNNPGKVYGPRMWHSSATSDKKETRIRYEVSTINAQSTSDLLIVQYPKQHFLWNYSGADYDYRLIVKSLTGNKAIIQMKSKLGHNQGLVNGDVAELFDNLVLLPGNYSDDFTYNLTY